MINASMIRMILVLGLLGGAATVLTPLLQQVSAAAAQRGR
jgi:type II secretory pathway pseudopilin PulG